MKNFKTIDDTASEIFSAIKKMVKASYLEGAEHQKKIDADLGSPKYEQGFVDGREYERKKMPHWTEDKIMKKGLELGMEDTPAIVANTKTGYALCWHGNMINLSELEKLPVQKK